MVVGLVSRWQEAVEPLLPEGHPARALPTALGESLERPAVTVVCGRVGVGKTTLVNRWCGTDHPTGLGRVTREPQRATTPGAVVVDTPGVDRPEAALQWLVPLLEGADRLVWVVDGLQPLTESERWVIRTASPEGLPVQVLVARGDLLGDEAAEVLDRVDAYLGDRMERPPRALDVRRAPLPELLRAPTPAARRQAVEWVHKVTEALPPAPLAPAAATGRARDLVRSFVDDLLAELHDGRLTHKVDARLALHGRGPDLLAGLLPGVVLPRPPPVSDGARERLLGSMSGIEGAERVLRADAASWLAEVQLAIVDAWDEHPEWTTLVEEHRAAAEATDALLCWLDGEAPQPE